MDEQEFRAWDSGYTLPNRISAEQIRAKTWVILKSGRGWPGMVDESHSG
jgi:hypothetical protein